ncbi:MAG: hypothetical protein JOZ62_20285 [Acidobacteriaceae bacterium]|nr:hypothetical protein [Acidobacteriaceae bacterium]
MRTLVLFLALPAVHAVTGLTGNWAVRDPRRDGTERRTYPDLKQEGSRITGHIRTGQFYYTVTESARDAA